MIGYHYSTEFEADAVDVFLFYKLSMIFPVTSLFAAGIDIYFRSLHIFLKILNMSLLCLFRVLTWCL